MKLSCSTTIAHRSPLEEALDTIRGLGFDHVDLLMAHGWAHVSPRELVDDFDATTHRIRNAIDDRGLSIAAVNVAFSHPLYGRHKDDLQRRREEAEAVASFMDAFDVSVAAVQPGGRPHGVADTALIEDASASWSELLAVGLNHGRQFALEPHTGSPFGSPDAVRELMNRAPQTTFAFDPSHLVGQGIDLHQVAWILERASHVHLRDAASGRVQTPYGSGAVDFDWILESLRARGYDGFVAVEYIESDEFDVTESVRELAALIRSA